MSVCSQGRSPYDAIGESQVKKDPLSPSPNPPLEISNLFNLLCRDPLAHVQTCSTWTSLNGDPRHVQTFHYEAHFASGQFPSYWNVFLFKTSLQLSYKVHLRCELHLVSSSCHSYHFCVSFLITFVYLTVSKESVKSV